MIELRMMIEELPGGGIEFHAFQRAKEPSAMELERVKAYCAAIHASNEEWLKQSGGGMCLHRDGNPL